MQLPEHLQYIEYYGDLFAVNAHETFVRAAYEKCLAMVEAGVQVALVDVGVKVLGACYLLYQHLINDPMEASDETIAAMDNALKDIEKYWSETSGFLFKYRWTVPGVITLTARLWTEEAHLTQLARKGDKMSNWEPEKWEPNHYGQLYPHLPCEVFRGN